MKILTALTFLLLASGCAILPAQTLSEAEERELIAGNCDRIWERREAAVLEGRAQTIDYYSSLYRRCNNGPSYVERPARPTVYERSSKSIAVREYERERALLIQRCSIKGIGEGHPDLYDCFVEERRKIARGDTPNTSQTGDSASSLTDLLLMSAVCGLTSDPASCIAGFAEERNRQINPRAANSYEGELKQLDAETRKLKRELEQIKAQRRTDCITRGGTPKIDGGCFEKGR